LRTTEYDSMVTLLRDIAYQ